VERLETRWAGGLMISAGGLSGPGARLDTRWPGGWIMPGPEAGCAGVIFMRLETRWPAGIICGTFSCGAAGARPEG